MPLRRTFLTWLTALLLSLTLVAEGATTRVRAGQTLTFDATVVSESPVNYRWYRGDRALEENAGPRLVIERVTPLEAGAYSVVAYNSAGSVQSEKLMIEVIPSVAAPVLAEWPKTVSVNGGESTTLAVQASGEGPFTYQWYRNGHVLPGEQQASITLNNIGESDGGIYTVTVTNAAGTTTSPGLNLILTTPKESRLTNFSIRSWTRTIDEPLIVGLGVKSPRPLPLLVRGAGPSLSVVGVDLPLADPRMTVFVDQSEEARNDDWGESGVAHLYAQLFAAVGAFPFASEASLDSALVFLLQGSRTIHLFANRNSAPGVALFEAYDLVRAADGNLVNLSAQNIAGAGSSTLILGFVIEGEKPLPILIRGVGPSLQKFGIEDRLQDPVLALYRGDLEIARNDNWAPSAELNAFQSRAGAFDLLPASKDAVILTELAPGSYTAHVTTSQKQEARALIELYAPSSR